MRLVVAALSCPMIAPMDPGEGPRALSGIYATRRVAPTGMASLGWESRSLKCVYSAPVVSPQACASNAAMISRQNAGRSSGSREVIRLPSRTTSRST